MLGYDLKLEEACSLVEYEMHTLSSILVDEGFQADLAKIILEHFSTAAIVLRDPDDDWEPV